MLMFLLGSTNWKGVATVLGTATVSGGLGFVGAVAMNHHKKTLSQEHENKQNEHNKRREHREQLSRPIDDIYIIDTTALEPHPFLNVNSLVIQGNGYTIQKATELLANYPNIHSLYTESRAIAAAMAFRQKSPYEKGVVGPPSDPILDRFTFHYRHKIPGLLPPIHIEDTMQRTSHYLEDSCIMPYAWQYHLVYTGNKYDLPSSGTLGVLPLAVISQTELWDHFTLTIQRPGLDHWTLETKLKVSVAGTAKLMMVVVHVEDKQVELLRQFSSTEVIPNAFEPYESMTCEITYASEMQVRAYCENVHPS